MRRLLIIRASSLRLVYMCGTWTGGATLNGEVARYGATDGRANRRGRGVIFLDISSHSVIRRRPAT